MSSSSEGGSAVGSIATLALVAVGSFFGPVGAAIGGMIGNALFNKPPVLKNEGSKNDQVKVIGSQLGSVINVIFGTVRTAGDVFWGTDVVIKKIVERKKVGKGGQKVENTTYNHSISFAILLGEGVINGVSQVLFNSVPYYDITAGNTSATGGTTIDLYDENGEKYGQNISIVNGKTEVTQITVYFGTQNQPVDPFIEQHEGVGRYTAHKGKAYIVIKNLGIDQFGQNIPNTNIVCHRSTEKPQYLLDKDVIDTGLSSGGQVEAMRYNDRDNNLYVLAGGRYIHKINPHKSTDAMIEATYDAGAPTSAGAVTLGGNNSTLNFDLLGRIVVTHRRGYAIIDTKSMDILEKQDYATLYKTPLPGEIAIFPPYPYALDSSQSGEKFVYDANKQKYYNLVHYSDGNLMIHQFNEDMGADGWTVLNYPFEPGYQLGWDNPNFDKFDYDSAGDSFYTVKNKTANGGELKVIRLKNEENNIYLDSETLIKTEAQSMFLDDVFFDSNTRMLFVKYRLSTSSSSGGPARLIRYSVDSKTVISDIEIKIDGLQLANLPRKLVKTPLNKFNFIASNNTQSYVIYYDLTTEEMTTTGVIDTTPWAPSNAVSVGSGETQQFVSITNTEFYLQTINDTTFAFLKNLGVRLASGGYSLKKAIIETCEKVKLKSEDILFDGITDDDLIKGYQVNSETNARGTIEQFSYIYNFSGVETDYKFKFRKNGNTSIRVIEEDEIGVMTYTEEPNFEESITTTKKPDDSLAWVVQLTSLNPESDYEVDTQETRMINTQNSNIMSSEMPFVLTPSESKQITARALYSMWSSMYEYNFTLGYNHSDLEPLDVVTLKSGGETLNAKIIKIEKGAGIIKVWATSEDPGVYDQSQLTSTGTTKARAKIEVLSQSSGIYLNSPALRNSDLEDAGLYIAAVQSNDAFTWPGAQLSISDNAVEDFEAKNSFAGRARVGYSKTVLNDFLDGNTTDYFNSFEVTMINDLQLNSVNETAFQNGDNTCMLGNEVIFFKNATLVGDRRYKISTLMRGRFDTEEFINSHKIGETFVMMDKNGTVLSTQLDLSTVNTKKYFKMTTVGQYIYDTGADIYYNDCNRLKAFRVHNLTSTRDSAGSVNYSFYKRVRGVASSFAQYGDVYDIDGDNYEVEIYKNNSYSELVRTIKLTSLSAQYLSSDQISDFGAVQAKIYVKIFKLNKFSMRGKEFKGFI